MSKKTNQQENAIDEIASKSERFVEKNISKILTVVLIIIGIVAGIFGYFQFVKKPKAQKAASEAYVAEAMFMEGQDSAALYGKDGHKGLLAIAKEYSSTATGNLSHAYAGICFYDMGKYQEALDELKKFSADESVVAPSIQRLIGDCYVQLNKPQDAAKAFEKAAKDANNPAISPLCLIKAGHVYETLKQYDKALQCYKEIKEKYYTAPEAESVDADIMRVEAQTK